MRRPRPSRPILLTAFAAGAGASLWVSAWPVWGVVSAVVFLTVLVRRRASWVLPACLAVMGLVWGSFGQPERKPDALVSAVSHSGSAVFAWVRGTIVSAEPWRDGSRADVKVTAFDRGEGWQGCACVIRSYLPVPAPADGSGLEASLRLTPPRAPTNPGQFDLDGYCERGGIDLLGACRAQELARVTPTAPWRLLARYRRVMEARLLEDAGPYGGCLLALLVGERGLLTPEQVDVLSASGLFHLVVLSGFKVGLLLVLMAWAAAATRLRPAWRDGLSLAVIAAYGTLVSVRPSLSRALFMAALFLLARMLARPNAAGFAWSLSLAVLLAYEPAWILDPGFQLTFAATLGILVLWNAYPRRLPAEGLTGALLRLLWMGFSAQLATLPFVAFTFHRVSLLGWLATPLAALPIMAIQGIGVPYLMGLAFVPGLHILLGKAMEVMAGAFLWLPQWMGRDRIGCVFLPAPWWAWVALYTAGLVLLALPGKARRVGWVLATFAVVAAWASPQVAPERSPRLTVLDVGQASCQVVEARGQTFLMDAGNGAFDGPTSARTVIEPFLAAEGLRSITGILLTHWDSDHSGAALDLVRDLPVGFLAYPVSDPPNEGFPARLASIAARRGTRLLALGRGCRLSLGGLPAEVLHPTPATQLADENDRCIVVRVEFPEAPVLFTGDLQRDGEFQLLLLGSLSPVYGLLVPHHGSGTSSTDGWVRTLRPRLAMMSLGRDNRFGHPSPQVIARYERAGARVLRTDLDGAIELMWVSRRPLLYRMRDGGLP